MSMYTTTFTATPIPQAEPAFTLLGAGNGTGNPVFQTQWRPQGSHVEKQLGQVSADKPMPPIVNRDRVNAAEQGSPPRGVPR